MAGRRDFVSTLLARARVLDFWPRVLPAGLVVLAYHRIVDLGDEREFPCDPELVSASVEGFEQQMEFVRSKWNPLSMSALLHAIEHGKRLPPRSALITFDDGHVDNYTHAFPVLRRLKLPATVFLSTNYIGGSAQIWFDRICTLLYFAPAGRIQLPGLTLQVALGNVDTRRQAATRALDLLKKLPDLERCNVVQQFETHFGRYVPFGVATQPALNWDQVREMGEGGFEFGSHTVSHPILSMLDEESIRRELAESRAQIERETGKPCRVLAYPVGKPYAFDDRVKRVARECGYIAALSYTDGVDDLAAADRFALKRVSVERYYSHAMFMSRMLIPRIFV